MKGYSRRRIRSRLWLSLGFLLLIALLVGGFAFMYVQYIAQYDAYKSKARQLNAHAHQAYSLLQSFLDRERHNEQYMETGKSLILFDYEKLRRRNHQILFDLRESRSLEQDHIFEELGLSSHLLAIEEGWQHFDMTFVRLQDQLKERGARFSGIMGRLHAAAQRMESVLQRQQEAELKKIFEQLRRHEQEFFHRGSLNYAQKVEVASELLRKQLSSASTLSPMQRETLQQALGDYLQAFRQLVGIEQNIGLQEDEGLRAEARHWWQVLHNQTSLLAQKVERHVQTLVWRARLIFGTAFVLLLVVALLLVVYHTRVVAKPIEKLDVLARRVVQDQNNEEAAQALATFEDASEVGDIARNFHTMIHKLKTSVEEARERDERLAEYIREEAKRKWAAEGLAIFGEILRSNYNDLDRQAYEIISTLVEYTECQMGAIFIVNDEQEPPYLDLKASYAFGRPKHLKKRIAWGEGVVGTAWREADKISLTDIPEDYPKIMTGSLIEGKPKHVLVVPLKSDNTGVVGVIELASIRLIEEDKVDFIERLSGRIASAIAAVKAHERNTRLLEASRKYAEELQSKERELETKVQQYDQWIRQLEKKLNAIAEEAHVYRSIISRIYEGIILTNERFIITRVNRYILKRFGYRRSQLEGQPVDILIETNYSNIIDLRQRRFQLSYKSFTQNVSGKVIDAEGKIHPVEMMAGKLEIDTRIVYVFLFNERGVADDAIDARFGEEESNDPEDDAIRL